MDTILRTMLHTISQTMLLNFSTVPQEMDMMLSYLPSLSKTTFERSSLIPSCHAQCRTRLRARMMLSYLPSLSKTTFERSSLIPSCHAQCRTRLRARNAAHDGEHIRQSSTIFLCLQWRSVLQTVDNFYLQHAECVFEFKWLYITVTSFISHDPSSIGCTTQRLVLPNIRWVVPITHIILLLLATGKCLIKYSWTLT